MGLLFNRHDDNWKANIDLSNAGCVLWVLETEALGTPSSWIEICEDFVCFIEIGCPTG